MVIVLITIIVKLIFHFKITYEPERDDPIIRYNPDAW